MRTLFLFVAVTLPSLAAGDFATRLYPALEKAQCRLCHNDNGVASATRLQFPRATATTQEIDRFGVRLRTLVDRAHPEESLLFRKPTNRIQHTGGQRIAPGSAEEQALRAWVEYLASLPEAPLEAERATGPSRKTLRRLTNSQYNHTVHDLLGDETRPADRFPTEDFVNGYTNQAEGQSISPLLAEAYGRAAERLARAAFSGGDSHKLIPCAPSAACRADFIRQFGRRAFRRPLTDGEVARYERLFAAGSADFLYGARLVVETMLQSPHFLFHLSTGAYATANRLSYFLWDTMPDEELLHAAESGQISSAQGIEKQVKRLLDNPRSADSFDEFLAQWMRFDRLRNAIRDRRLFPEFTAELVSAMTEETQRLFRSLVWQDRNFLEFFTADYAYLTPELAKLYGAASPRETWARVDFSAGSPRAGVLGEGTYLAVTSKPADTSPTERGLFVREHFLCQIVPPPPAGVNTSLPPVTDEKPSSTRERLQAHLSNPTCASCHMLVDSIGFGLEKFDAIGKFREKQEVTVYPTADELKTRKKTKPTEYKLDIEGVGTVRGLQDSEFHSARELGRRLAREPICQKCIVKQLFRYANGRSEEPEDQPLIEQAYDRFRDSQFRFRELIVAIASSMN
jgi:Protein of unknown function (DUF1592)/Protein of unknown function (DUF1588)/Protein of unknown function (DUF1587)/Protein of unknown function (DUF1595)/Protein of unknown function (DUF1585)